MRITGGAWRGRRLPELKGFQGRPTTDFGREGLFNLLSSRVADPPYDMPKLDTLPDVIRESGILAQGGWFILEHGERMDVSDKSGHVLSRKYGHVHFSLFTFE